MSFKLEPTGAQNNWLSDHHSIQSSEKPQDEDHVPSSSAPSSDEEFDQFREEVITNLMKERGLSREVAESQFDALS